MLYGFDIETKGEGDGFGLQPYRVLQGKARITSAAIVSEKGDVLFSELEPDLDKLVETFSAICALDPEAIFIGHNTPFDVAWMIAYGYEEVMSACNWIDSEVLRRCIENDTSEAREKSYGLKASVAKYIPEYAGYEKGVNGDFDTINAELLEYNTFDAALTAQLGRIFIDHLTTEDPKALFLAFLISQAIVPFAGAWVEGLSIDVDAMDKWETEIDAELVKHLAEVMRLASLHPSDEGEAKKMLASPDKLKRFLHIKGYPVAKTDRIELSKYADTPLIKAVSDWKKANTAKTRFLKSIRNALAYNGNGRTHPACRLFNTYTGRVGYTSTTTKKKLPTGFAVHQTPRDKNARNCIIAPDGMILVEWDFATQESRLICDWSSDPVLLDIFTNEKDIHTYMAAMIVNMDYEELLGRVNEGNAEAKEQRYLGKVANLSLQYRTGWKKLIDVARTQYEILLDATMAQRLHKMYRETYKNVPLYWDTAIRTAKANGFAETRGGRKVHLDDWSRMNSWASESTAINFPIQGTGADMKFLALSQIKDDLREAGGKYLLDLHDAAFALLPDTSAGYETAHKCQEILSNLPYREFFNWSPRVALPVDMKIGFRWGELKDATK